MISSALHNSVLAQIKKKTNATYCSMNPTITYFKIALCPRIPFLLHGNRESTTHRRQQGWNDPIWTDSICAMRESSQDMVYIELYTFFMVHGSMAVYGHPMSSHVILGILGDTVNHPLSSRWIPAYPSGKHQSYKSWGPQTIAFSWCT